MAKIYARKRKLARIEPPITLRKLCEIAGIDPRRFHLLRIQGLGPTLMRVNGRLLVSPKAACEWIAWLRDRDGGVA